MKQVAKIIIIDEQDKYLLMKRSDHPIFSFDADLPGGTVEEGEDPFTAAIREVLEETGIALDPNNVVEKYSGDEYSAHQTKYYLYVAHVETRPDVVMSWEHSAYEWVSREVFLKEAQNAIDTFMHMACKVMK